MNPSEKRRVRRKTKMVKIENEKSLQVTFSKRCAGLFKKASELGTLCRAETAVIVFSPGNRPHSFGHPNVEAISNRFLNEKHSSADKYVDDYYHKANSSQQALEFNHVERQLEFEQKRTSELNELARKHGSLEIDKLDYNQLSQLKGALLCFRKELEAKMQNGTSFKVPYDLEPHVPGYGNISGLIKYDSAGIFNYSKPNVSDLVADDLCPIIPYSASATSFDINPSSGCNL